MGDGEEAPEVAVDYVYNNDIAIQVGKSYVPARRKYLTPVEMVNRIRFTTSILNYTRYDASVRGVCLHAMVGQQADDDLPLVVPQRLMDRNRLVVMPDADFADPDRVTAVLAEARIRSTRPSYKTVAPT